MGTERYTMNELTNYSGDGPAVSLGPRWENMEGAPLPKTLSEKEANFFISGCVIEGSGNGQFSPLRNLGGGGGGAFLYRNSETKIKEDPGNGAYHSMGTLLGEPGGWGLLYWGQ
jgi:hypothetical protein